MFLHFPILASSTLYYITGEDNEKSYSSTINMYYTGGYYFVTKFVKSTLFNFRKKYPNGTYGNFYLTKKNMSRPIYAFNSNEKGQVITWNKGAYYSAVYGVLPDVDKVYVSNSDDTSYKFKSSKFKPNSSYFILILFPDTNQPFVNGTLAYNDIIQIEGVQEVKPISKTYDFSYKLMNTKAMSILFNTSSSTMDRTINIKASYSKFTQKPYQKIKGWYTPQELRNYKKDMTLWIILGCVVGGLILLILLCVCCCKCCKCCCYRDNSNSNCNNNYSESNYNGMQNNNNPALRSSFDLENANSDIKEIEEMNSNIQNYPSPYQYSIPQVQPPPMQQPPMQQPPMQQPPASQSIPPTYSPYANVNMNPQYPVQYNPYQSPEYANPYATVNGNVN